MKILLAEDDVDLNDVTAFALRRQGYTVLPAYSGTQAIEAFESEHPDVVLLDMSLPALNGLEVLRRIRERSETPLIVLTGRRDEAAMVEAFNGGADDYMTKPFSFRQLFLRVQAVSRRLGRDRAQGELSIGDLTMDPDTWSATCGDQRMSLTRLEFRILYCLASYAGRVTPSDRLLRFVWRDEGGDVNVLKTHISHVRQKLAAAGVRLQINAVPGIGYVLKPEEDAVSIV